MRFENKGAAPKGGSYLVCEAGKRGMACQITRWRYDHFETSFLAFVQELDLETLAQSNDDANKRVLLDDSIRSLQGELFSVKEERERIYQLLLQAETATAFVLGKMQECEGRLSTIEQEIATKEQELSTLASKTSKFYEGKEEIKLLIDRLQNLNDKETYKLRSQIASRLSSIVSSVVVAPLGHAPSTRQVISELKDDESSRDEVELAEAR